MDTVFTPIIEHKDGYIVWEDSKHIAFLTPYPNTPGLTVVVPKLNSGDYIFNLDDGIYAELMLATKHVAKILETALDVSRVGLVFEGTGIPYVHAKLYPLYGDDASKTNVWSDKTEYTEVYNKYLTTLEGPKMSDAKLREIQQKIIAAQKSD